MKAIEWVFNKNFKNEKGQRAECTDNAISTLGKCIYFYGEQHKDLITP